MTRCRGQLAVIVFLGMFALSARSLPDVCTYTPPRIRELRGVITTQVGLSDGISNARVSLRRDSYQSLVIAEVTADTEGRFRFPQQADGKYFVQAEASGFRSWGGEIKLSQHAPPRKELVIVLPVGIGGGGGCDGNVYSVESRKIEKARQEQRKNPRD